MLLSAANKNNNNNYYNCTIMKSLSRSIQYPKDHDHYDDDVEQHGDSVTTQCYRQAK
jgi:hypothetical protein